MYNNKAKPEPNEEGESVIRQLNIANIETEEGVAGYSDIDRVNAKYYILLLLIALSDKKVRDKLTNDSNDPEVTDRFNYYKDLYQSLKKKATLSVYTNPAKLNKKGSLSQEYRTIVESQLVENHILGSLKAMFFAIFPDKNSKDYEFEIDDIFFKKIIKFEEKTDVDDEGNERITYNTSKAFEEIKKFLPKFYHEDKFVSEVLAAIETEDEDKYKTYNDFLIKKIVAILTSEVKEKERIVNNKRIVEKVITCNTDGKTDTGKKSFISSVTIGNMEFKRENIVNTSNSQKEITCFRQPDRNGIMKTYLVNKDSNYIFELPVEKDINTVNDEDEIKIYEINTGRCFDSRHNAVCKNDSGSCAIFSFYDESNKRFVYCSPYSNKVFIGDCSNNKFYKNIISISSFNEELDSIIENIDSGVLRGDELIDSACKKIGIDIGHNPHLFLVPKKNRSEILKIIRKYGMCNTVSPLRPDKEGNGPEGYDEKKLKKLINAKKSGWFGQKFGLNRDDNDVKDTFSIDKVAGYYGFQIEKKENDEDENTRRALEVEYFLKTTMADSFSILEFKDGKIVSDEKAEKFDRNLIENNFLFSAGAEQESSCSYSGEIFKQQNAAGISKVVIEEEISNNPFVRKQDLSEHAYLNYENTKKIEEFRESEKKKMKNKRKSNGKPIDYSYINKQYEQMAVNSINYAVKKLYNMEYKSFFEKILIFFGFMEDKNPTTYKDLVNNIVKNIGGISFSAKEANYIQGAIDYGAAVSGEDRYDISNTVTISLNTLNKGKGK